MNGTYTASTTNEEATYLKLYSSNLIPLYTVLPSLVWVLHDYFETLEDEVTYMWDTKPGFGKFMYFWMRYYTIFLVLFDVVQIHSFAIPGVTSLDLCLAADPVTRIVGAISLWSVEIIMQMRIYVLYNRSKRVALINSFLFIVSISAFIAILTINAIHRKSLISSAMSLPLKGCPTINSSPIAWTLWMPPMLFEFVLFGFVIHKSIVSMAARRKINGRTSLAGIMLHEHILYFFIVACILVFNNLMTVGATRIPWFGFGPFHAALGITTGRMLIHLRKFSTKHLEGGMSPQSPVSEILFSDPPDLLEGDEDTVNSHDTSNPVHLIDILEVNMVADEERSFVLAGHQHQMQLPPIAGSSKQIGT